MTRDISPGHRGAVELSLVLLCMLCPLGALCMRPVALPATTVRDGHGQEEDAPVEWRGTRRGAVEGLRGWDAGWGSDGGGVVGTVLERDARDDGDAEAAIGESRSAVGMQQSLGARELDGSAGEDRDEGGHSTAGPGRELQMTRCASALTSAPCALVATQNAHLDTR